MKIILPFLALTSQLNSNILYTMRDYARNITKQTETWNNVTNEIDKNIPINTILLASFIYGTYRCFKKARQADESGLTKPVFYIGTVMLTGVTCLELGHFLTILTDNKNTTF